MGYEIIDQRAFIATTRGIIPMCLHGSNNCTELVNGREVRERYWSSIFSKGIEVPNTEIENFIKPFAEEKGYECFKYAGKFIYYGEEAEKWFRIGLKAAKTIEVYRLQNPRDFIEAFVCLRETAGDGSTVYRNELYSHLTTTKEIEDWLDKAAHFTQENPNGSIRFGFFGREKMCLGVGNVPNGKVAIKRGPAFLIEYTKDESLTFEKNPSKEKILIFDDILTAKDAIGHHWRDLRYISADAALADKPYIIKTDYYAPFVVKKTTRGMEFSRTDEDALRFASEKDAEKYIQKYNLQRFNPVIIKKGE